MAWTPDATDLYFLDVFNTQTKNGKSGEEIYFEQVDDGFDFNNAFLEDAQKLADYANGLSTYEKYQIKATYDSAKASGNTKLAKIMDEVFKYGKTALELLVATGVIKTASNIAPDTVDVDTYDRNVTSAKKAAADKSNETNTPKGNSTYFGIDFSSPIVWLIIIGIVILFFAFNSSSNKPQQVYIPQQQPSRR